MCDFSQGGLEAGAGVARSRAEFCTGQNHSEGTAVLREAEGGCAVGGRGWALLFRPPHSVGIGRPHTRLPSRKVRPCPDAHPSRGSTVGLRQYRGSVALSAGRRENGEKVHLHPTGMCLVLTGCWPLAFLGWGQVWWPWSVPRPYPGGSAGALWPHGRSRFPQPCL